MHVGIIPDGQRRWAKLHGTSLQHAYAIGFSNGVDIAAQLCDLGASCISVFALSSDNYKKRPNEELEAIMLQVASGMIAAGPRLATEDIAVRIIGDFDQLSSEHQRLMLAAISAIPRITNPRAEMNVLVNYSMSWDFSRSFSNYETREIRDCDLIFRSGGMRRLSGFLPKQAAYSELFFSNKLWPDVTRSEIDQVIAEFRDAIRNFGA